MEFAAICSRRCTPPATLCKSTCPSAPTGAPTSCAACQNAQPIAGSSCAACLPNPASERRVSGRHEFKWEERVPARKRGSFSSDIRLAHQSALAPEEASDSFVRESRSVSNVEVHHAIWRLVLRAVHGLYHQAVTARSQIFHVHHQAAWNHRISLLNKIIHRRKSAKE